MATGIAQTKANAIVSGIFWTMISTLSVSGLWIKEYTPPRRVTIANCPPPPQAKFRWKRPEKGGNWAKRSGKKVLYHRLRKKCEKYTTCCILTLPLTKV